MTTPSGGNATTINSTYLQGLQTQLEDLLASVKQVSKQGYATLTVQYPGGVISGGTSSFDIATQLNNALTSMGGTVADELSWLEKVLTDMISEITTTISSLQGADGLNSESVDTLIQDFQNTITDMDAPPVSSSSSGSSSGGSSSGTTT
jgi:hypothetical protein